jgi:protein-arginine kinase activator protein McsA
MSHRFIAIAITIVLAFIWIVVSYARLCLCDSCKAPFAVFARGDMQYCWSCHRSFRRHLRRVGRRRSLLRRIFRTAA